MADGDDPPTLEMVLESGCFTPYSYWTHFGSWEAAVREAMGDDAVAALGIDVADAELLAEIRRLADGDDPPNTDEMDEDGDFAAIRYYYRFGSWQQAVSDALDGN